jgi:Amt family ammonium transporter
MDTQTLISNLWLMIATALVFFMQAGFCVLETGSVRSKNSVNVALKNVVTFIVSAAVYYVVGYSLHFGRPWIDGIIGRPVAALGGSNEQDIFNFLYQMVFCTTAATIVSGGVAERMRFLPYILGTIGISLVTYPVFGHWAWNSDGWLHRLGYHDFAGSSVVHMTGAMVCLAGIVKVGVRKGRFDADGKPRDIHASDVPLVALGVFILMFGWIGFNGGSAPFGAATGPIVLNTLLAGIFGGITCLLVGWAFQGISGASTIMNGILAGLVAITASADIVTHHGACIIGCAGGLAYFFADRFMLRIKLDDAVGAVPVHGAAGITGILLTAVFAKPEYLQAMAATMGHAFTRQNFIVIQAGGGMACALFGFLTGYLMWSIIGPISRLRVTEPEENVGLNYSEHQVRSPVDEIVGYVAARSVRADGIDQPQEAAAGEYARVLAAVEGWAQRIEKERGELEQVRGWLGRDADRLYEVIRRCDEENRQQAKRLEAVAHKVELIDREVRTGKGPFVSASPLVAEVLESVRDKLKEMQAGGNNVAHYWEQLRTLGSSLFRNTRTLEIPAGGSA